MLKTTRMSLKDKLKTAAGITLAGLGLTALVETAGCGTTYPTNTSYKPQPAVVKSYPPFFLCNFWADNGDGAVVWEELVGFQKKVFYSDETITAGAFWPYKGKARVEIKSLENGKTFSCPASNVSFATWDFETFNAKKLIEEFNSNRFVAIWYLDENKIDELEFIINPK